MASILIKKIDIISALASKKGQISQTEVFYYIKWPQISIIFCIFFPARAEITTFFFVGFLEELEPTKIAFLIFFNFNDFTESDYILIFIEDDEANENTF